ncbi:MAG: PASTA domain-containing protein [Clostridia bacterium]|nr:PASTA domain-containing protein [Clostridia bacterium]
MMLTIDSSIQSFCERAAREALSVNNAKAVRILAMDPNTGEILAMVNKPDYDLNDPPRKDVALLTELMRNRCITDAYEPGSTFKILTSAAALDSGLVTPNEGFYCSGSTYVEGGRIRCWGKPHGAQSFAEALQNSCNPVFVEMGLRLGIGRFYDYMDAFGLGSPTGVDLPGEAGGIVISESVVKRVDIARIGFGQSVAVTPLQLLTATSAVVNGGNLLTPYIVKTITDGNGEVIRTGERQVRSNPISAQTSATMRTLLEGVVAEGGGKNAAVQGYRIGGKTGTAQVYVDGVVSTDKHIGSFVGFAPINDPRIAVLVIVEEADVAVDFGSVTAAPYAKDILEQSLMYLGIAPQVEGEEAVQVIVPDVTGMNLSDAAAAVKDAKLDCVFDGEGGRVVNQLPAAGASMAQGSLMMLYVDNLTDISDNNKVTIPDVSGLSVLEANRVLRSYGLKMQMEGSGLAVSQAPAAGEAVLPTTSVAVRFELP